MCFVLGSPGLQDLRSQEQNSNSPCPASSRAMAAGPGLDRALHYPPPQLPWDCRLAWQNPPLSASANVVREELAFFAGALSGLPRRTQPLKPPGSDLFLCTQCLQESNLLIADALGSPSSSPLENFQDTCKPSQHSSEPKTSYSWVK